MSNEAAEVLRRQLAAGYIPKQASALLDEALDTEHKATVEWIRAALAKRDLMSTQDDDFRSVDDVLDAAAVR